MTIIIDLIIVALIALFTFLGYKKGLIKVAFKILSFFIAILIALVLFKPVSSLVINNTQLDDNLKNSISQKFQGIDLSVEVTEEQAEGTPKFMLDFVNKYIAEAAKDATQNIAETVSTKLTETIISAGVILGLYIVARILLMFARFILEGIANLPFLKQFNEVGGLIYGLLKGLFIVYFVLAIISLTSPMYANAGFLKMIDESFIGSIMYNSNIVLKLIF
ncbi:MAG: CvpA family protein [Clostridia bacterium]|nr:CvpA family protein [Clostridia bacterium]